MFVQRNDVANRGQGPGNVFDQRPERPIDNQHLGLAVVNDVGNLWRRQPRVNGCQNKIAQRRAQPDFEKERLRLWAHSY